MAGIAAQTCAAEPSAAVHTYAGTLLKVGSLMVARWLRLGMRADAMAMTLFNQDLKKKEIN